MNLSDVNDFLIQHSTCVLASIADDDQPIAATVGFSHRSNFEIMVGTNNKSYKYQNIKNRSKVAIVVGFEGSKTVQLEGVAREFTPSESELEAHYNKVPAARKFQHQEGQTYLLISPSWLRFTDYSHADQIFETRSFN